MRVCFGDLREDCQRPSQRRDRSEAHLLTTIRPFLVDLALRPCDLPLPLDLAGGFSSSTVNCSDRRRLIIWAAVLGSIARQKLSISRMRESERAGTNRDER
jgi:hypothetical protein